MNCEQTLAALESGNPWRRRAARRHAANCPACGQAVAALTALKRELATAEPLSPAQRERWLSAVATERASAPLRRTPVYVAVGAAAAAVIVLAIWLTRDSPEALDKRSDEPSRLVATSTAKPLTIHRDPSVRQSLLELSAALDQLADQASLLDERRQLRELVPTPSANSGPQQP